METELIQIEVQRQAADPHIRMVTFHAPPDEVLVEYANSVCRNLGGSFLLPEVQDGLAAFLRVWAQAFARDLTAKHNGKIDSRIE